MKFQLAFATFLSFAAAASTASTAAASDEIAYVIETRDLGDVGILTVYGITAASSNKKSSLQARQFCGDNSVICSDTDGATREVCDSLLVSVCNGNDAPLSASPRSICLLQSGDQCCINWSSDVGAISSESALCQAAQTIVNDCASNAISGAQIAVPLNGGCVTECVSNKATGCSLLTGVTGSGAVPI